MKTKTNTKKPLLVVCGPTATGKTSTALLLAKKLNGELISADSRQIYKGMDVGTGKDIPRNSKLVMRSLEEKTQSITTISASEVKKKKHKQIYKRPRYQIGYYIINHVPLWLYDVTTPDQRFSAYEYARLSRIVVQDIRLRNKLPVLVGGTGLYIKAAIDGLDTEGIPENTKLRKKLQNWNTEKLQRKLKQLDPYRFSSMNNSDKNNPRRLMRAIEIAEHEQANKPRAVLHQKPKAVFVGLTASKDVLLERIHKRVDKRVREGVVAEIDNLLKKGYLWDDPGMSALGYKEWRSYFEKKATASEIIRLWKQSEYAYARRQMAWFNKNNRIRWFDVSKMTKKDLVERIANISV